MRRRFVSSMVLIGLAVTSVVACGGSSKASDGTSPEDGGGAADFGTLSAVCGPAEEPNVDTGSPGVTVDSIEITTISDASSSLQPGLNQELWDAAHVFAQWCNDQGGIHGRTIQVTEGDAQLTLYKEAIQAACNRAFALVGGGGAFDNLGQTERVSCLLPDFPGFQASSESRTAALSFPANPTPIEMRTVGLLELLRTTYPQSIERLGFIYGDFPSVKMIKAQIERALVAINERGGTAPGWPETPAYQDTYAPVGDNDWSAKATAIRDNQVTALIFEGQPADLIELLRSLGAIGYEGLQWVFTEGNLYDQTLISGAGSVLDTIPVYIPVYLYPFDAPEPSAALTKYKELFAEYRPEGKSDAFLGINAFSSWLLFAQSASACGAELTRACLVEQVTKTTEFDAGGLTSPRNPSNPSESSRCFTAVRARSTGFEVWDAVEPNQGIFNCDDANRVNVDIDLVMPDGDQSFVEQYPLGPTLADVGKSLDDLT